ncbi:multicomponent Na+:H+ antiporter subunit E [Aliiruegeria haliotis]|uniref:Multicomponent Na+:H+ antiporter subunit E n=1 Tax=Aliiruegeria haliotis TaxID=1280846 RepID=A0A2T0RLP0_9RHOB|nr:Na+/H+ antiporter subunit E [Aliiruegeria haliotis]PRY22104.1 multicomponent Na+:H+ antiporter subunit E [Aliiruegeria haliotis]
MKVRQDFASVVAVQGNHPIVPDTTPIRDNRTTGKVRAALGTGVMLAAAWAVLHWDDPASWVIGLPTAVAGAAASTLLPVSNSPRISFTGALRLSAFAITGVLRGAVDVSLLSLRPGRLNQGCLTLRTRLPEGRPRRLFALTITLLPGTLTVRLDGEMLVVHALDCGEAVQGDLDALEHRIAGLFGLSLKGENT